MPVKLKEFSKTAQNHLMTLFPQNNEAFPNYPNGFIIFAIYITLS